MDIWLVLIILHACSALVCFVTGVAIISPQRAKRHTWLLPAFLISLIGLLAFMVGAMASHWSEIGATERIAFSGLVVLGLYMLYRGLHAKGQLHGKNIPENYIDNVGFSLISLFNGFIIVALIDMHAPVWLVVAGAVLGVVVGTRGIALAKRRYL